MGLDERVDCILGSNSPMGISDLSVLTWALPFSTLTVFPYVYKVLDGYTWQVGLGRMWHMLGELDIPWLGVRRCRVAEAGTIVLLS